MQFVGIYIKIDMEKKSFLLLIIHLIIFCTAVAQQREDIPLHIYNCVINGNTQKLEKGTDVELYINFENWRNTVCGDVKINISLPNSVHLLSNSKPQLISGLPHNHTQATHYVINIPNDYSSSIIPIDVYISNLQGKLCKCYLIELTIGQDFGAAPFSILHETTIDHITQHDTNASNDSIKLTSCYRVSTNSKLNVRSHPSMKASVIGQLSNMESVEVIAITKGWAEIKYKGEKAFVSTKYIVSSTPAQQADTTEQRNSEIDETIIVEPIEATQPLVSLNNTDKWEIRFVPSASMGFSNLYSFDAKSSPRIACGASAGIQVAKRHILAESSLDFLSIGNSNYVFPSIAFGIYPLGYRYNLKGRYIYTLGGFSIQLPLGGGIFFSRNSQYYSFYARTTLNLMLKTGIEVNKKFIVGVLYLHGLNNVCHNLPIGLKHESCQIFCAMKFGKF